MCEFFNVSCSGYYDYVKRIDLPAKDLALTEKIWECRDRSGKTYGYCRIQNPISSSCRKIVAVFVQHAKNIKYN